MIQTGHEPQEAPSALDTSAWWSLPVHEVLRRLDADGGRGLEESECGVRRHRWGSNTLPEAPRTALARLFLRQFRSPLIYLLLVAAGLAGILREFADAGVIVAVLLVNAGIGALQEGRAQRAMESLRRLTRLRVRVLRGGREREIDAAELVPGDVLALAAGDAIAADARLLESVALEVDESVLTGESLPVRKRPDPVAPDADLPERSDMLFAGTHVTAGHARALVVATGPASEFGRLAALAEGESEVRTPLEQRLARFGRVLLVLALASCAALLVAGHLRGLPAAQLWMVAISQLVSVVPEGLPVALTVGLAVGMQRMAAQRAIVRRLAAVETLGSTSVICSDKTGTLTRNEMTATALVLPDGRAIAVTGVGYAPEGRFVEDGRELQVASDPALGRLLEAALLCNDAEIVPGTTADPRWMPVGDPTEAALVTLARKGGLGPADLRARHLRTNEVPFEAAARWMATEHAGPGGRRTLLKGAPEVLLPACSGDPSRAMAAAEALAGRALRVLAVAELDGALAGSLAEMAGRARLLGLIGQLDPPRPEARAAIETCAAAGVRVLMVTGDHPATAAAVAQALGLQRAGGRVIEGVELARLSEDELMAAAGECRVFARILPAQKLRLVESLRRRGEVVAMTGDGVNDAPALVRADVGVAMGLSGTDVARQAADIVLTDDDFKTIVQAVEEGRVVHRNLQKIVLLLLSTALAEVLVLLLALSLGCPLPFAAVQILWNNVVTEGTVTVNLALDPRQGDEMSSPPVPRAEPLLTRAMLGRMLLMSATIAALTLGWFVRGLSLGRPFAEVQTGAFVLLAVCEWFNLLSCRSATRSAFATGLRGNRWLAAGLALSVLLQAAVVCLPAANALFHTVPLPLVDVLAIVALASCVLWVEELRKLRARARAVSLSVPRSA